MSRVEGGHSVRRPGLAVPVRTNDPAACGGSGFELVDVKRGEAVRLALRIAGGRKAALDEARLAAPVA